ncbi:MAG: hypothetical protein A2Z49_06830 [Chloroflexi bacterium RBG_19FT_COMBO_56_12]|nr:MAG: hypothetical protein A2Z49_06830 [Chloroflexi bacterium RBG_19FT_COMBO_56_12]
MDWLNPSLVASLAGTVFLATIYFYLYLQDKEHFLGLWTVSWCVYALRLVFQLWAEVKGPSIALTIADQMATWISGLLLLWGAFAFLGRQIPRWSVVQAALGSLWIAYASLNSLSFQFLTFPTFILLGSIYIFTGVQFLLSKKIAGPGKSLTGWAFILWGLHKVNYPLLRPVAWFAPWGFLLASLLSFTVGLGMILVYYFRIREELRQDVHERQQAQQALQNKTYQQERLIETARYMTESLDLQVVLERIGKGAKDIMAAYGCTLYLLEADGKTLTPVVAMEDYAEQILSEPLQVEDSLTGQAVINQRGLIFNNAFEEPSGHHIPGTPQDEDERVCVAPFIANGQVLGAMCLNRLGMLFTSEELALAETFATYAATALNNAKSHAELKRTEEELERKTEVLVLINALSNAANRGDNLQDIIQILAVETKRIFSCFGATIYLLSEDKEYLNMQNLTLPPKAVDWVEKLIDLKIPTVRIALKEHSLYRKALQAGKPQLINDPKILQSLIAEFTENEHLKKFIPQIYKYLKIHSVINAPLISGGKSIGLVELSRKEPFNESELLRLEAISEEMSIILQHTQAEEALRKSEDRFRRLAENAQDIIYRYNFSPSLRLEYISPAVTTITGYTPEEHYADSNLGIELVHPDDRPLLEALVRGDTQSGMPIALRLMHKDGKIISTEHRNVSIYNESGDLVAIEGIARDVTDRAQREREMETVVTVATALRAAQTSADMLPIILEQVNHLLHPERAAICRRDPLSSETVIELASGNTFHETGQRLPPGEGIVGHVITTGKPYLTNNGPQDAHITTEARLSIPQAFAAVPLVAMDQTLGALVVGRESEISEANLRLLTVIAEIAASAIRRAALFEETQRRLQRLDALHRIDKAITTNLNLDATLTVLLEQITSQLAVDAADILLPETSTQTLHFAAGQGFHTDLIRQSIVRIGDSLAGRAALERQLFYVPDLRRNGYLSSWLRQLADDEKFIAYVGVPLTARSQVKGVLELFQRAPLDNDQDWWNFLDNLAQQAAIAIDNASLFADLQNSNQELTLAYDKTLEGWAMALELRDKETEGHSKRVTELTLRLAQTMGMSAEELLHVRRGTMLHDIGKMGIPDSILLKPGPLSPEEWEIMHHHPIYAYNLLSPIPYLEKALDVPYCHHEKWDGSGYPRGLQGEQIPLAARIFSLVDVYDALLSDRPYRPAWPKTKVRAYLREQAGLHFDPKVVEAFFKIIID